MAYKFMYNPNYITQNYLYFISKLVLDTFGHSIDKRANKNPIKVPKVLNLRIRKCYYNTLGTSVINSPLSPIFLECDSLKDAWYGGNVSKPLPQKYFKKLFPTHNFVKLLFENKYIITLAIK